MTFHAILLHHVSRSASVESACSLEIRFSSSSTWPPGQMRERGEYRCTPSVDFRLTSPYLILSVPLAPSHPPTPALRSVWRAGACGGPCAMALSAVVLRDVQRGSRSPGACHVRRSPPAVAPPRPFGYCAEGQHAVRRLAPMLSADVKCKFII